MKRARAGDPGEEIAERIMRELERSGSHRRWTGAADTDLQPDLNLDFRAYRLAASSAAKEAVQVIGQTHGCHTCLTKLANDTDQPWIGDHCPPTELDPFVRRLLGIDDYADTHLFPQCHDCSQQQSAVPTNYAIRVY